MFQRIWAYIKQLFKGTAESVMDPRIEIEAAISEAKKQDQALRNQAAKVIAHRTQLEQKLEKAADTAGESREIAKQALMRAEESKASGDTAAYEKWTRAAQAQALKMQAAENNLNSLREQYEIAAAQADEAKKAVQMNASRVQELAAKRMELLGQLEQAKMQESVNQAMSTMTAALDMEAPSLASVEEKISRRMADAKAHAELAESTPEGAEAELREAISIAGADAKLEELRAELGLNEPGA
ncbi:MAG: PspA/IM30 family protein [Acidimicrobiia bacterium]